jgi:hypothetical protein
LHLPAQERLPELPERRQVEEDGNIKMESGTVRLSKTHHHITVKGCEV